MKSGLGLLVAMVTLGVLLGGCASSDEETPEWAGVKGQGEPAKLVDFNETAKFDVRWHSKIGDMGNNPLKPALNDDAIYAVSAKGRLTRLERASGDQKWSIESGLAVSAGVASGNGLVLIGSDKGDVYAYGEDGKLRWKTTVTSEVLNVTAPSDGVVIVRSGDGNIAALDAADGKRNWLYEHSTPALVVRSHAGVVIQRGVVYAGFAGGRIAAISIKDGNVLWETFVSQPTGNTELERISDITSAPVVDDDQVCAIAFQGKVACFEPVQGGPIWSREISSDKGMVLLRKFLYLTDADGYVMMLDKTTGSTEWKNGQMLARGVSRPCVLGDFVIVGDYQGYVHAMTRDDGRFVARTRLDGGAITVPPVEMDGGLLVVTQAGDLYSLAIK